MKEQSQNQELQDKYRNEYRHEPDYSKGGEIDKQLAKLKEMGLDLTKPTSKSGEKSELKDEASPQGDSCCRQ